MKTQLYEYARCRGADKPECRECLRFDPGLDAWRWLMTPPDFEEKCPLKIEVASDENFY